MNVSEINFCGYFESVVLPNKGHITNEMINKCFELIGEENTFCPSCLRDAALDLLNLYNRLLPYWDEYKANKPKEIKIEPIKEEIKIEPKKVEQPIDEKNKSVK